jgi:anti-sigma factor RsiW
MNSHQHSQHHRTCQDIANQLNQYVDGDLDPDLCAAIEAHMDSCTNCQIVFDTLKKTIHLYQMDREDTTLPPDARRRLFACLDLEAYLDDEAET